MKEVYIVTQGEYSDYHIVAVFDDEALAQQCVDEMNGAYDDYYYGTAGYYKYQVNPGVAERNQGLNLFHIIMDADGTTEKIESLPPGPRESQDWVWERTKAAAYRKKRVNDAINATVWAKDEQHAIKIVNERRSALRAANQLKLFGER